jgi:alanine racemase
LTPAHALDGLRPTWTEVDLDRLQANTKEACRLAGAERRVLAVVKADAYGHGAVSAGRAFAAGGASALAVGLLEEALELRAGGIEEPVVILGPLLPEQLAPALDAGATTTIYCMALAEALDAQGARRGTTVGYHLKIDTGMGRLGIPAADLGAFLDRLPTLPNLRMDGIFTHLPCADDPDAPITRRQFEDFRVAVEAVRARGHAPAQVHVANSAALLREFPGFCSLVRPGLALYGYSPAPAPIPSGRFAPALSLHSRVVQVKRVTAGATVGYGSTWTAARESVIATVPLGYEDGYPRALGNRAHALLNGLRAPVVGRVSMDLTTLDVSDLPPVQMGDPVLFLGRESGELVDAWDLARWSGTIVWEILCGLGRRVPRLHVRDGKVVEVRAALAGPLPSSA